MSKVIVYNNDITGFPSVIVPTEGALKRLTIQEIAVKDVPAGKPFKIIDFEDLPTDAPQEAWEIDDADLTDGFGGAA